MDRSTTELAFLAGGGLAANVHARTDNAAAGVHGLDLGAEWADADPADWRTLPEPDDADQDDDEDAPIGAAVLDLLGFDPDDEDWDEEDDDDGPPTEVLGNTNPEGCNQYTGPGCGGGGVQTPADLPPFKQIPFIRDDGEHMYHATLRSTLPAVAETGLLSSGRKRVERFDSEDDAGEHLYAFKQLHPGVVYDFVVRDSQHKPNDFAVLRFKQPHHDSIAPEDEGSAATPPGRNDPWEIDPESGGIGSSVRAKGVWVPPEHIEVLTVRGWKPLRPVTNAVLNSVGTGPAPAANAGMRKRDTKGFTTSTGDDHQPGDRVEVEGKGPGTFKRWHASGDAIVTMDSDGDNVRVFSGRVKRAGGGSCTPGQTAAQTGCTPEGKEPPAANARARTDNAFCPTGPGGGIDPTCSPGDVGHTATAAHARNDQQALDAVRDLIARVGTGRAKRGELGVAGLRTLAKQFGIKGHSALKKAGLSQAIQAHLSKLKATAPAAELADRLERVGLAERHSGIKHEDRVINGVLASTPVGRSARYKEALADVARNGANAKAGNVSYLKAVRDKTRAELAGGDHGPLLKHVLEGIAENGHGTLSPDEFRARLVGGRPGAKGSAGATPVTPGAPAAGMGDIIPDDLTLKPARGRRKAKAPPRPEEYDDRLRQPLADRLSHAEAVAKASAIPFAVRVIHALTADPKVSLPGKAEYHDRAAREAAGQRLTEAERRAQSGFRASVVSKIKFGDVGPAALVRALEAVDGAGHGTLRHDEFVDTLKRKGPIRNVFCPTGKGGGVKPDCGKGDAAADDEDDRADRRARAARAIQEYVEHGYEAVNNHLRGGKRFKGWARAEAKAAAEAMLYAFTDPKAHKVTAGKTVLHRGVGDERVRRQLAKLKVGDTFSDKAFLSTSTSHDIAARAADGGVGGRADAHVIMTLVVPKGTKYLDGKRQEKEMILEPGMTFKVTQTQVFPPSRRRRHGQVIHEKGAAYVTAVLVPNKGGTHNALHHELALSPPYDDEGGGGEED